MLKKNVLLVVAGLCLLIIANVASAALPETVKMVIAGSDPELKFSPPKDGKIWVTIPVTNGQLEKLGGKNRQWTISGSKAIFRDGQLVLIGEASIEKYRLPTRNEGNTVVAEILLPEPGHVNCYRIWGDDQAGTWLWISQASVYCRLSSTDKPGYEFAVYPDGHVEVIPKGWVARP